MAVPRYTSEIRCRMFSIMADMIRQNSSLTTLKIYVQESRSWSRPRWSKLGDALAANLIITRLYLTDATKWSRFTASIVNALPMLRSLQSVTIVFVDSCPLMRRIMRKVRYMTNLTCLSIETLIFAQHCFHHRHCHRPYVQCDSNLYELQDTIFVNRFIMHE